MFFSNTGTTDADTTDTDLDRKTAALANGIDYIVFYYANCGGSDTSAVPEMSIWFGDPASLLTGTRCGYVAAEGRGSGTDHWDSGQLQGVTMVTGDGTSVMGFSGRALVASDTSYFGAFGIVCIPTTEFSATVWFEGDNLNTEELVNAETTQMNDVVSTTFADESFAAGDYLVVMSMQAQIESADVTGGYLADFTVDDVPINPVTMREEAEDTLDYMNCMAAEILTLGAGTHTFKTRGQSQGAATVDFSRSRILVVKLTDVFDQYVSTVQNSAEAVTATTYGTSAMCETTYTPNQQEYVFAIGTWTDFVNTTDVGVTRIVNTSDTTVFCEDAGEYLNNSASEDAGISAPFMCEQISAAKNYAVQLRTAAGTATWGTGDVDSRLLFWGLTTSAAPPATAIRDVIGCGVVPFAR